MSSQAFFWVNAVLGLILILFFLRRKKSSRASLTRPVEDVRSAQKLSSIFVYNGHNFDAFEVLGLPSDASLEVAQKSYENAIRQNGSDRTFLEAAFKTIQLARKDLKQN
jgi:hypothetical protein